MEIDFNDLISGTAESSLYGFDAREFFKRAHVYRQLKTVGFSRMTDIMEAVIDMEQVREAGEC